MPWRSPPPPDDKKRVEIDEKFLLEWVAHGISECEASLRRHALFDAFYQSLHDNNEEATE